MKFRQEKPAGDDAEERMLEDEIRRVDRGEPPLRAALPDAYWQNLIIRTNAKIDDAESPRAIGTSWLARVAIPGVVAVVAFVVALHYYAPVRTAKDDGVAQVVKSMPSTVVDSLFVAGADLADAGQVEVISKAALDVPEEQIAEYFINNDQAAQLLESMNEEQANAVLSALGSDKGSSTTNVGK